MSSLQVSGGLSIPTGGGLKPNSLQTAEPNTYSASARLNILWLPDPPARDLFANFAHHVTDRGERVDAVVLDSAASRNLLTNWMSKAAAAVVPIIDASGQLIAGADVRLPIASPQTLTLVLHSLVPLIERIHSLPESVRESPDPRLWLLARLATRDLAAEPRRDITVKSTICFAEESAIPNFLSCAERLARSGHLERRFFDRLNVCHACSSARLLIREECRDCRSSDILEEAIIHHLRCAYQGPERDFRDEQALVCPKCRAVLEHFSVDYDRPGTLIVCNTCGHATGEPAIGYLCLDCGSKGDTNRLRNRIIHSYILSERGRQAVLSTIAPIPDAASSITQGLRQTVRLFIAEHRALGIPCAILVVRLDAKGTRAAELGEDTISAAADFFADMVRETFAPETEILRNGMVLTVLISSDSPEVVKADLARIRGVYRATH